MLLFCILDWTQVSLAFFVFENSVQHCNKETKNNFKMHLQSLNIDRLPPSLSHQLYLFFPQRTRALPCILSATAARPLRSKNVYPPKPRLAHPLQTALTCSEKSTAKKPLPLETTSHLRQYPKPPAWTHLHSTAASPTRIGSSTATSSHPP